MRLNFATMDILRKGDERSMHLSGGVTKIHTLAQPLIMRICLGWTPLPTPNFIYCDQIFQLFGNLQKYCHFGLPTAIFPQLIAIWSRFKALINFISKQIKSTIIFLAQKELGNRVLLLGGSLVRNYHNWCMVFERSWPKTFYLASRGFISRRLASGDLFLERLASTRKFFGV